jgi:hypothetical protein
MYRSYLQEQQAVFFPVGGFTFIIAMSLAENKLRPSSQLSMKKWLAFRIRLRLHPRPQK